MTKSDDEKIREDIRELVRKLFRAENGPGGSDPDDNIVIPDNTPDAIRSVANGILATDYLPITRGKGQVDRNRDHTLEQMVTGSSSFRRHVGQAKIEVDLFLDNRVAIARSLLSTTDSRDNPPTKASYRNMHVFLKRDDGWKCAAWQVTRVQ